MGKKNKTDKAPEKHSWNRGLKAAGYAGLERGREAGDIDWGVLGKVEAEAVGAHEISQESIKQCHSPESQPEGCALEEIT